MAAVEVARQMEVHDNKSSNSFDVTEPIPTQPDIQYHPDEAKWKTRTARRLAEDPTLPTQPLPEGFPEKLVSPLVWEGKDWQDESQWVYNLSQEQLDEIDHALHHFKGYLVANLNVQNEDLPYCRPK
jgi:hypothetical protein